MCTITNKSKLVELTTLINKIENIMDDTSINWLEKREQIKPLAEGSVLPTNFTVDKLMNYLKK